VTDVARIDHLVVAADTLDQGAAWCQQALGVPPGPGGEHPLMGTHNRLLRIATVDHPRTYLEIIAANPAQAAAADGRRRWFDLDDATLRTALRDQGPRLVHWVAQVPDLPGALTALAELDIDPGAIVTASRVTPRGLLQWQITVRDDGRRLFDGCLPTLIAWGDVHPAAGMAGSGVTLHRLAVRHPRANELRRAFAALGLQGIEVDDGPANLCATLLAPHGTVRLESKGL